MPEHTPVLCPNCGSPLATTEETCWSCGKEGAFEAGREQVREERSHRAAAASGGDHPEGEGVVARLRSRARALLRR